jgi:hypothetical protein
MRGKAIALSVPRRFVGDILHFARQIPTVPVQRQMNLHAVLDRREVLTNRPGWVAIFTKAYALVAEEMPELRRAYVKLPWPHLYEYPESVAAVAVERSYEGEPAVFIGRIRNPASLSLTELSAAIRALSESPIDQIKDFRRAIHLSRWPGLIRRPIWWLGLNLARQRANKFGTFSVSVYSSLGAESLHPLSPLTTTLNYGVIAPDGKVDVRIIYDHRVLDGSVVARALARLESVLQGPIVDELGSLRFSPGMVA